MAPAEEASRLGNRELFGRLATDAMLPVMEAVCRHWGPDLVLRDPCEYSSAVVAPEMGIPVAQVAISTAAAEQGSIAVAGPVLEMHRPGLVDELRAMAYLTRFPASFDPSGFGSTVRYREGTAAPPRTLPDWWDGQTGPLIYVTFGTVLPYMSIAAGIFRAVVEAVVEAVATVSGSRVLLCVGTHFDPTLIGPVPHNVHVEAWVDQADILPGADLVVCHGGSGTALGALGAGVPMVAVPVFADQFENARLVAAAGAGKVILPGRDDTGPSRAGAADQVPGLTGAVETVLLDPAYRAAASRIAAEMADMPRADEVLAELLRRS